MQLINTKQIVEYEYTDEFKVPKSIDKKCGYCARIVNFKLDWYLNTEIMFTTSRCSGCGEISRFYLVEIDEQEDGTFVGNLYISPVSLRDREMVEGIEVTEEFSDSMYRAYRSAVNVYNLGEWSATVVLCRRLLEGITSSLLPDSEHGKPLYRQLEMLSSHVELQKPILTLAHAIRLGGNLGAHFDLEREPDENLSKFSVDLLDYIIEYLYILPRRIEQLHNHIEELPNKINKSNP